MATLTGGRLTGADLHGTGVTDQDLAPLIKADALENLNLSATQVSDLGIAQLASIQSLRELELNNLLASDNAVRELTALPRLARLSLENTLVEGDAFDALPSSLEVLSLAGPGARLFTRGARGTPQAQPTLACLHRHHQRSRAAVGEAHGPRIARPSRK
ncbi:MAG: hypothetical protein R2724_17455 [Bryobacterales bacterium]